MRFDFIAAVLIFSVSTTLSAFAYRELHQQADREEALIAAIPIGTTTYHLRTAQGCSGTIEFEVRVDPDGVVLIEGNGTLALRQAGIDTLVKAHFGAGSDSFGYVGFSQAAFDFGPSGSYRFSSDGIDPIALTLSAPQGGAKNIFKAEIPGPFTLRRNKDGSYRLTYLHVGRFINQLKLPAAQSGPFGAVSLEPASDAGSCTADALMPLDITAYMTVLKIVADATSAP